MGLVFAVQCTRCSGCSPLSKQYRQGAWPLVASADLTSRQIATAIVPTTDGISADYLEVPHLTHRAVVYSFPNPWRNMNYGVKNSTVIRQRCTGCS